MPSAFALVVSTVLLAAPQPSTPTLATEDTLHTEVPEVLVRAPRVTLEEILDRVARGEARRDSMLEDQSFTVAVRLVRDARGPRPRLLEEAVWRVFRKRPDKVHSVLLRRVAPARDAHVDWHLDFSPGTGEEVVNFAFQPRARRDYRYRIAGRDLVGDHLIYRLEFEPRSPLAGFQPSGLVWVDTNDFVIAREELRFRQSPLPLILRGVDRMVVERQRVGDHWVLRRVLLRGETTMPLPKVGKSFDLSIQYQDYAVNEGLDDRLFPRGEAR
jgi:hypothetical protein